MTDKKLLELAAKAAGYELRRSARGTLSLDMVSVWNPLTDDGDALRLAVKLQIDVIQKSEDAAFATNHRRGAREPHNDDQYAATRRAIVRAAAEIGKGMK